MVDLAGAGSFLSGLAGFGGLFGGGLSERKSAALQAQYNREVLQNQLQWRAKDAEAAGISKHYAMGAPVASFAPSVAGGGDNSVQKMSDAGQAIGRAAQSYADSRQRKILFEQEVQMNALKIKDAEINVQKNASDLVMARTGATPALNSSASQLIAGQNGTTGVSNRVPLPATTKYVSRTGSVEHYPSQQAAEAIEDNVIYQMEHFFRNRIAPFMYDALDNVEKPARRLGRRIRSKMWQERR